MNNLASQIFKRTRTRKSDGGEDPCIKICVNPNIQDKYILTTRTSPVDYAGMLLPQTKNMQGKK